MAIITGKVEAISSPNKFGKHSILLDKVWYTSLYPVKCDRDDTVEFEDAGKKYIRDLKVISKGAGGSSGGGGYARSAPPRTPGFPVGVDTKDRSIVRQNSLGHAVRLVAAMTDASVTEDYGTWEERETGTEVFAQLCVSVARIFEDYSSGDSDGAEAAAALDE